MGTPKEIVSLLKQAVETVGKNWNLTERKNQKVIETEIKAETARNFFSPPFIVEHASSDDIPELPTPKTPLSERYQED